MEADVSDKKAVLYELQSNPVNNRNFLRASANAVEIKSSSLKTLQNFFL